MGKTSHDLLDLLHDPTFQHLYQRSDNEIMNWSKFRLLPMPAGYETEEVWGVIEALRRLKSHRFPYRPYTHAEQPAETWCSLTNHIGALLREIVVTAHENASEQIRGGQYRFLDILSTDLSAALERDGISLPSEVIHSLATRQRQAASHDEHVAAEAIALLLEIDRYARYPISPWMIEDVLSHFGAETSQLHRAEDAVCQLAFAYNTEPPERIIDTLLQTMNARCLEPELYLLNLLATSTIIWDLLPFCAYNGLLDCSSATGRSSPANSPTSAWCPTGTSAFSGSTATPPLSRRPAITLTLTPLWVRITMPPRTSVMSSSSSPTG